jgi:hypothetical protein
MSTAAPPANSAAVAPSRLLVWAAIATLATVFVLVYLASRRQPEDLATGYGLRRGAQGATSVNGTSVLARLFEKAGHRVSTVKELSSQLDDYNTIVWAPDEFSGPSEEVRAHLETWIRAEPGRTLVYIGRDYDAAPEYWRRMLSQVESARWEEYQRRLAHAQSAFDARRTEMPDGENYRWFVTRTTEPARKIPDLDGPWAAGIDASQTDIRLAGRLDLPNNAAGSDDGQSSLIDEWDEFDTEEREILLQSENDILAHRLHRPEWSSGQIVVVANGSFTLNLPLVNKEHRKLAAKLVAQVGEPGNVAFLESGPGGLRVNDSDSSEGNPLYLLGLWPISFIVVHFAALGILYCIAVFPIFGRPHQLPADNRADFGQHVAALGELLQRTKDVDFAESRIRAYQAHAKRGSGQSHRNPLVGGAGPPWLPGATASAHTHEFPPSSSLSQPPKPL